VWNLEHPPPNKQREALALIAAAGRSGTDVDRATDALEAFFTSNSAGSPSRVATAAGAVSATLWWASENDTARAAVLVVFSPGRTALLLHSSAQDGIVPPAALADVLAAAADEALARRVTIVQALLAPTAHLDIRAYGDAGFAALAELIYMRTPLSDATGPTGETALTYRTYSAATHDDFATAITDTYAGSLDCPALTGLRDIGDVLVSHKATGIFRPDMWSIAYSDGHPAGVLLLNENTSAQAAEIVYMGVGKQYRGRHMGRDLVQYAAAVARRHRFDALCLAVDAANTPALRVYKAAGFIETHRRLAYMKTQ